MNRTPVKSSNICSVGYDPFKSLLTVEFLNGSIWAYKDVPVKVYDALMAAPSVGSFLAREIKPTYASEKVS